MAAATPTTRTAGGWIPERRVETSAAPSVPANRDPGDALAPGPAVPAADALRDPADRLAPGPTIPAADAFSDPADRLAPGPTIPAPDALSDPANRLAPGPTVPAGDPLRDPGDRFAPASAVPAAGALRDAAHPLASAPTLLGGGALRGAADPLEPAATVRTLDALHRAADLYVGDAAADAAGPARVASSHRRAMRWAVSPRAAAVGAVAVALVGGAVALHATTSSSGDPVELPTPGAAATSAPTVGAEVVVDVVGEVAGPGVVRLPAGSRVVDAVAAAGGATRRAQLASLNLARVLVDGEQIVVPRRGAPPPAADATTGADALVDVNTADAAALDALPGIGPVLAQRIVDERAKHPFSSVDELADVPGIGPSLLARLRPLVRT